MRVFVLHAEEGAGKMREVVKWVVQVPADGWRGGRRDASSKFLLDQALSHFGHTGPRLTNPTEQGRVLTRLVAAQHGRRCSPGLSRSSIHCTSTEPLPGEAPRLIEKNGYPLRRRVG